MLQFINNPKPKLEIVFLSVVETMRYFNKRQPGSE